MTTTTSATARTATTTTLDGGIVTTITPAPQRRWVGMITFTGTTGRLLRTEPTTRRAAEVAVARVLHRMLVTPPRAWTDREARQFGQFEVARRGGETSVGGKRLEVTDRRGDLTLLHVEGFRQYSRAVGAWRGQLSYLVGRDDAGLFAARVPGTVTSVADALAALEPAAVRGRQHRRQGDVYLVRLPAGRRRSTPSGVIRGSHHWDAETRTLDHEPRDGEGYHEPVTAPASWPGVLIVPQLRFATRRGYTRD